MKTFPTRKYTMFARKSEHDHNICGFTSNLLNMCTTKENESPRLTDTTDVLAE